MNGYVVCQAPAHITENRRLAAKAALQRGVCPRKGPKGFVPWDEKTFEGLIANPPEALQATFKVDHGLLLALLQRDPDTMREGDGFDALMALIERSHTSEGVTERLKHIAQERLDELILAGLVHSESPDGDTGQWRVDENLQTDFSLMHTLSLPRRCARDIDASAPAYGLNVLSFVRALPRIHALSSINRSDASKTHSSLNGKQRGRVRGADAALGGGDMAQTMRRADHTLYNLFARATLGRQ